MFITVSKNIIRIRCLRKRERIINQHFLSTKQMHHILIQQQGTRVQVLGGIELKQAREQPIETPPERIAPIEAPPLFPSTERPEENIPI